MAGQRHEGSRTTGPADGAVRRTRVAVACQGGGSHTAFTSGVLGRLFEDESAADHDVVALSGTSGGAVCALLAWYALLRGEPARATELLDGFWSDNAASSPPERIANAWAMWAGRMAHFVPTVAVNPSVGGLAEVSMAHFRGMLERRVDFSTLAATSAAQTRGELPYLVVGAANVLTGRFKAFDSRRDEICAEAILASAAIPTVFHAVRVGDGLYWDGLFSQNPPVRELIAAAPDEIWVIRINPAARATEPLSTLEIDDRRNELSGNMSLAQELHFIEVLNGLLDAGTLSPDAGFHPITVRVLEMPRNLLSESLGSVSKLNRDPGYLRALRAAGRVAAERFLAARAFERAWREGDAAGLLGFLVPDCELHAAAPFTPAGPDRDPGRVARYVTDRIVPHVDLDVTRKEIVRDAVAWTVRRRRDATRRTPLRGTVTASFTADGRITRLVLGPADPGD